MSAPRVLTQDEVKAADISGSEDANAALRVAAEGDDGLQLERRTYRVFAFGDQRVVVDAKTALTVWTGMNSQGQFVYEAAPFAKPMSVASQPGYVVPPSSAWVYNTDGSIANTVGTWKRTIFWTINAAWNYKACSSCTAYQYFRMFGKMQAATITGATSSQGFKRAWLEFDNNGVWGGSPTEFEFGEPEQSYPGTANQVTTYGFSDTFTVTLGEPPASVGGTHNETYGGSMTRSTENWHPVVRAETASGGVQWCRYEAAEFTGTKVIAARVSIRQAVNAQLGGWNILYGMQDFTSSCPSQI